MKISVIGATGKTGLQLVQQGLDQGYKVTGFVRDTSKMEVSHPNLTIVEGDVLKAETIDPAVVGQDYVFCALGADGFKETTTLSEGTKNVIAAMQRNDVNKLIVITVMGAHESWQQLSLFARILFRILLKNVLKDHERQEIIVQESSIEYVIVRPGQLVDGEHTGHYTHGADGGFKEGRLTRANLADFMLTQIEDPQYWGKAVVVT
ncbi:MAG: SDR family oxidoreductase [Chloroflexota bacterium]